MASNISSSPITVTFSTGTTLSVPAGRTVTSGAFSWSGGSAGGGTNPTNPPTTAPPTTPPPTTAPPTTPPPTTPPPTTPPPTTPPPSGSANRYLLAGGGLAGAGTAGTVAVPSAGGTNHDGTPFNPATFTATGLTFTYNGGATAFDLFVDAGGSVGNATQVRVSYDLTGNGSFERVETYRYFATDPVTGYEHYTQAAGLASATGALGNLSNGTVRVEVWSAIGNAPTTLGIGNQSIVRLPYA
ncbi:hypothetical protein ACFQ1L_30380 [Phytohabitans flavus]|uniref:hypothetical protein n=1 Tax=Phytohabitans flavus TaxID=1076124 RepID=UPI00363C49DF